MFKKETEVGWKALKKFAGQRGKLNRQGLWEGSVEQASPGSRKQDDARLGSRVR